MCAWRRWTRSSLGRREAHALGPALRIMRPWTRFHSSSKRHSAGPRHRLPWELRVQRATTGPAGPLREPRRCALTRGALGSAQRPRVGAAVGSESPGVMTRSAFGRCTRRSGSPSLSLLFQDRPEPRGRIGHLLLHGGRLLCGIGLPDFVPGRVEPRRPGDAAGLLGPGSRRTARMTLRPG